MLLISVVFSLSHTFWHSTVSLPPCHVALICWIVAQQRVCFCVSGYYLYTESSRKRANDTARILSQPMTIDSAGTCLHFWYHMYGSSIGTLNVYAKINGRWAFSVKLCFAVWWGGGGGGDWLFCYSSVQFPQADNTKYLITQLLNNTNNIFMV